MCEICKSEGKDAAFVNGTKDVISTQQLYKVYKNSVAPVRLCYIHSIELFMIGEKRFLKEHLSFAHVLITRSKKISSASDSPFGF
ncbi:MAG: hypothetical protein H7336_10290 [Bacteriovorax sp.]|nr:hypothetical protein [Bacteriovorax sp.]